MTVASGHGDDGIGLLADWAERDPDAIAVVHDRDRLTFAELAARSERVAARLVAAGVRPDHLVGLLVERGVDMVVAVFAVLRAGGAYVPVEPRDPVARQESLLADAGVRLVLTQRELAGTLPGSRSVVFVEDDAPDAGVVPWPDVSPDNLAYVMYTSGSTGRPKGVMVTRRGLANLFAGHAGLFADPAGRLRVAHTAALSFDASWMPLLWLLAGHELHVVDRDVRLDPHAMVEYVATHRIDVLDETPAYLHALLRAGLLDRAHRPAVVVTGGEAVDAALGAALRAAGVRAHNGYGVTESTVESLLCPAAVSGGAVLGAPLPGVRAYVLDAALRPVEPGDTGELHLAGPGLARGYLGRAGATAAAFVADPFAAPGDRMYRTGDLVRGRPDGRFDFLGRADDQVAVHGVRIEPGEVEAALLAHPAVAGAAVVARRSESGHHLVGYVVPAGRCAPDPDELRAFLAETLPGHLVPARIVPLAELPLTRTGKVDRDALPAPPDTGDPGPAPATPAEELVARVWCAVLGLGRVGVDEDFVGLGGDSIHAMLVVGALHRRQGTVLPARAVFEHRTVRRLAAQLGRADPDHAVTTARDAARPLSFGQQRLWFLDEFAPGGAEYNTCAAFRLHGPVDVPALTTALDGLARRHESLRTTFHTVRGRPTQVVSPRITVPFDVVASDPARLDQDLLALVTRPFDLRRGPLVRAALLGLGDGAHLLVLTMHHIVTDGWSMGVLAGELGTLYSAEVRGEPATLPALPLRYADFAAWQRDRLAGPAVDEQIAYWERQLAGVPAVELPTDRPRPVVRTSAGALYRFTVPASLTDGLVRLGRSRRATLFTTLVAAVQVLLARYGGQRDVAVGTVTSGRSRVELAEIVGFFVNTVVIRSRVDGSVSFADFLTQVRSTVLDAMSNDEVPFDRLVELIAPERDASRSPLVQVMIVLQNAPSAPPRLAGLRVEDADLPRAHCLFDLTCEFEQRDGALATTFEYSTDLFDAATIRRLAGHLLVLLAAVVAEPARPLARLPLLSTAQRHEMLVDWNGVPVPAERCVHDVFAERAAERPSATAITAGGVALTYRELDTRANRLAHALVARGAGPDVRVGVCLPRSVDAVVAMLAVLKAGAAFVPLDPGDPGPRLAWLLADSGTNLVLTRRASGHRLPGGIAVLCLDDDWDRGCPDHAPDVAVRPDNLVYVMYTSGSTGQSKGVLTEHRSVTRLCADPHVRLGPDDVLAQYAPLAFDASTFEIWGALLSGARLAIGPAGVLSVAELGEFLRAGEVTALWLTAGLFHEVAAADVDVFGGLRRLVCGGDVLSPHQCGRVLRRFPHLELVNGYGPTEGTTFSTCHRIADAHADSAVPIGRPVAGTRCYVLDRDLNPVPVGVPGELYVGGSGLARGYLGRPGLTAQRFVADPFGSGTRLYRTGDVVRWRPDGVLDFVGRTDDQVKIRGFRVELGEVETALRRHAGVAEAVVLAREDTPGHKRLVGYVVTGGRVSAAELRAHLEAELPGYLVPADLVELDRLPLTANGKVDRAALPIPQTRSTRAYVPPRGPAEEALAGVWAQVLGVRRVGAEDNFFDLGGDSILSIQVVSRAAQLGLRLTAKDVFLRQTLAALAACATAERPTVHDAGPVCGPVPLSPAQHWFFDTVTVHPGHFNQWVAVDLPGDVDQDALRAAVHALARHHDALRARFTQVDGQWRQDNADQMDVFGEMSTSDTFDLGSGPLFAAVLTPPARLVLLAHHLVVDGVSWRILVSDLVTAYRQAAAGEPVDLGPRTTSFRDWCRRLREHATGGGFADQLTYWAGATEGAGAAPDGPPLPQRTCTARLPADHTRALLHDAAAAYRTRPDDLLLSALGRVLSRWTGHSRICLELEGHGRADLFDGVDLSRTVGWFTALYPFTVRVPTGGWAEVVKSVKEQLRAVPDRGVG
ncbi:MAG TPA: amino acid adenylation domain-containing protein, partial [Pseudonocardiaceae bacterium]|nr:amino acid adenylation domain-containing protein [Pseudonocardiaceae bacterium]